MKILLLSLSLIFLVFAALQYNDPDSYFWATLYGVIGLLCFARVYTKKLSRITSISIIIYAMIFIWRVSTIFYLTDQPTYKTEEVNEAGGLLLACLTLIFLNFSAKDNKIPPVTDD